MASTATPLGFNKQGTGDNVNTHGVVLNEEVIDLIDEAIRGRAAFALTGTVTLTATNYESNQARCAMLHATSGTGGTVVIPAISKLYVAWNQSTGAMVISTGGATTTTVDSGDLTLVFCDGDKVRQIMVGGLTVSEYVAAAGFSEVELPAQAGNAGKFVQTDGTNATWQSIETADIADYIPVVGKQAIWIPAAAMLGRSTNGAGSGLTETTTNKIMLRTLDFDASTIEYAQFQLRMPKSWNEGTVSFIPEWSHGATTVNFGVSWGLQAVAISNDDPLDAAFGTAQFSNDTGGTTSDAYAGPESAAITIAGTPAVEDLVVFQVLRKADDGTNDTLAVDAKLHGVTLFFTNNAGTDD